MNNYDILKEYEAYKTPLPSYEEWMEKTKSLKVLAEAYCKEKQQNDKIKELLKECKGIFDECFSPSVKYGELYKQIDEVLK